MRDANRGDLASLVEVSASHMQVKMKNEMVVTFIADSLRSVSHEEARRRYTSCWGGSSPTTEIESVFGPSYANIAISSNSACRNESTTGLSSSLDSWEIIG
jgi:hypothetical protein